mmetsp:Transcript_3886/g.14335  ORF Transcript_3886/g.14335 Transcript_3886/m.14335 type:complete len:268 (-) Transcript_3886:663-1466(-)
MPISARIIVEAWFVSTRLAKITPWHTNVDHCVRTLKPSRLLFCFQNPMSCLNARNANQLCSKDTAKVTAIHRQSCPVKSSLTSSKSLSVKPKLCDIIFSDDVIWCVKRNKPMCIGVMRSSKKGSFLPKSELNSMYSRRGTVMSSAKSKGAYAILWPNLVNSAPARTTLMGKSLGMPFRRSKVGGLDTTKKVSRGRKWVTGPATGVVDASIFSSPVSSDATDEPTISSVVSTRNADSASVAVSDDKQDPSVAEAASHVPASPPVSAFS